tara:strand:- start:1592 stop:2113 length:522 start_codon:yes stop_codon:yes gene_type:complete
MPDYEQVDTEIFATEQEPVEEEEVVEKPKRVLSEKQIDALARGRAKVAENREKKRKLLLKKKKDEDFVKQAIEEKIANRVEKRAKLKSEREQSKREKLLEKKKQAEEQKAREVGNSQKIENWVKEREKALDNCETIEEFDELSGHLDSITEEDILDNKKLHTKLNKIYALYKV